MGVEVRSRSTSREGSPTLTYIYLKPLIAETTERGSPTGQVRLHLDH